MTSLYYQIQENRLKKAMCYNFTASWGQCILKLLLVLLAGMYPLGISYCLSCLLPRT